MICCSVCFYRKKKEEKKKLISISTHLAFTNCIIFYYKGANYSISVTWLMRTHTSQPPLHTHKNVIISVLSLVWPRCILQNVWFISPAKDTSKSLNVAFVLVWCTFLLGSFALIALFPWLHNYLPILPAMLQIRIVVLYCLSVSYLVAASLTNLFL